MALWKINQLHANAVEITAWCDSGLSISTKILCAGS